MKSALEILLRKYRADNRTKFLCSFIETIKFQEPLKKELLKFIRENSDGKEAMEICNRYNVKLQVLPMEYGLFADNHLTKRKQRVLRIEWLKLLIANYEN